MRDLSIQRGGFWTSRGLNQHLHLSTGPVFGNLLSGESVLPIAVERRDSTSNLPKVPSYNLLLLHLTFVILGHYRCSQIEYQYHWWSPATPGHYPAYFGSVKSANALSLDCSVELRSMVKLSLIHSNEKTCQFLSTHNIIDPGISVVLYVSVA